MFTVKDEVANKSDSAGHAVSLRADFAPRHAADAGYYILHEGLIGVSRRRGPAGIHLQEDSREEEDVDFDVTNGWLGITDKYWAATLLPPTDGAPEGAFLDAA